jgi:hypothetical protein
VFGVRNEKVDQKAEEGNLDKLTEELAKLWNELTE